MRIIGYVRETPGRDDPDTVFVQSERIRRWTLDTGNEMVATCHDPHSSVSAIERSGYRTLVEIVRLGRADAVVVASLDALSPDKVNQEIMLADIRSAGATIISTDESDLETLQDGAEDHVRMVVRDIVAKVLDYSASYGLSSSQESSMTPEPPEVHSTDIPDREPVVFDTGTNVVVELIAPTG